MISCARPWNTKDNQFRLFPVMLVILVLSGEADLILRSVLKHLFVTFSSCPVVVIYGATLAAVALDYLT